MSALHDGERFPVARYAVATTSGTNAMDGRTTGRVDRGAEVPRSSLGSCGSPQQSEAVDHFSRTLMNKFLHEPSVRLRAAAANGRGLGVIDTARYLFGLEPKSTEEKADNVKEPSE